MAFLDENYLLTSKEAQDIFLYVKSLPIVDAHTHVDAEQIAVDHGWDDIWEVEGATDHYVWELMRRCGVSEEKITGDASNKEKWLAFAEVAPRLAGNPLYEWIHLDLRRRFEISDLITPQTAESIWEKTKEMLASPRMRPQALLKEMKVEILCTTDSPLSDLRWHEEIRRNLSSPRVLPTWRPDEFMAVGTLEWNHAVEKLAEHTDENTSTLSGFLIALEKTHRYFRERGGVASDHGIEAPYGKPASTDEAAKIFQKAISGEKVTGEEERAFKAFLLHFFAELNTEAHWVMQLHIGAVRDYRDFLLRSLGKDSGGDVASHAIEISKGLYHFLNAFDGRLKIVLYAVHPGHIYTLATLARAFPNVSVGSPWWFMDNPFHIRDQLLQVANVDVLSNYAGMVTDSRKLFSFQSRTEVFRRVLADVLGEMVNHGRVPLKVAKDIGAQVAYYRPKELFFEHKEMR